MKKVLFALLFSMSFAFVAGATNAVPKNKAAASIKKEVKQIVKAPIKTTEPCTYCIDTWRGPACAISPDSCMDAVMILLEFGGW